MNKADLIDWGLHLAMSRMPTRVCSDLGARLSGVMGKRPHPEQHRRAMALFARLRPELADDPLACEAAVDRLWANMGRTFAEFAVSHRILRAGGVKMIGQHHLDAALASGRPVLMIFPHLGNWELSEMQVGFHAPNRGAVIVAPPASKARADIAHRVRSAAPATLLPVSKMVWRRSLEQLKRPGGVLMLAVDEHANGRIGAPAFGRPYRLDGNLGKGARLALQTKAMILPFHNERLEGARFVTHFLQPFDLEGAATDEAAIQAAVRRMDAALEDPIKRLLEQWYMALFFTD